MTERVNHPEHYNFSKFEVIDVIFDWTRDFCLGNALKYIARAGRKENEIEDLRKAKFYLQYFITNVNWDNWSSRIEQPNKYPIKDVLEEWRLPSELSEVVYYIGNLGNMVYHIEVTGALEESIKILDKYIKIKEGE